MAIVFFITGTDHVQPIEPCGDASAGDDREQMLVGDVPPGTPGGTRTRRPVSQLATAGMVGLMKGGGLMLNECDCVGGSHC